MVKRYRFAGDADKQACIELFRRTFRLVGKSTRNLIIEASCERSIRVREKNDIGQAAGAAVGFFRGAGVCPDPRPGRRGAR